MPSETKSRRSTKPFQTPEEQELARKREEQKAVEIELADYELHSANFRAELRAFEQRYLQVLGLRYAELDELKAKIAEREASESRAAKASASRRKASAPPRRGLARPIWLADETTPHEASRIETPPATPIAREQAPKRPETFAASPEMKRLYREVAKQIHPDLTSDATDRSKRQRLMVAANEAYERGDEAQLTKILTDYESRPEAVQGEGPTAELIRTIRRISQANQRIEEIKAETQELSRSDLCQLMFRFVEAGNAGSDALKEMAEKVEEEIAQAKERLANGAPAREMAERT